MGRLVSIDGILESFFIDARRLSQFAVEFVDRLRMVVKAAGCLVLQITSHFDCSSLFGGGHRRRL
ncbi:MAG: hypothetical protein ACXVAS_16170, partial [Vulcanimicrobiaceae bacterium]